MTSTYQVITVANLEAYAGTDYGALYSGYSDTVIEANISSAERKVLSYCGSLTIITEPAVIDAVSEIAMRKMYNLMIHDSISGYSDKKPFLDIFDDMLKETLNDLRAIYGNKRKIWIGSVGSW
jgi:hypothetical protein